MKIKELHDKENPTWELINPQGTLVSRVVLKDTQVQLIDLTLDPALSQTLLDRVISEMLQNDLICNGEDGDYYYLQNNSFIIYQLPASNKSLFKDDCKADLTEYCAVYRGSIVDEFCEQDYIGYQTDKTLCELLFKKFNLNHPRNFAGHSLSVSDIIVLVDTQNDLRAYRCKSIGFEEISNII